MARLTPLLTALHRYDKSLSTWGRGNLALESLRSLKRVARDTGAELWPNHDLAFYRRLIGS